MKRFSAGLLLLCILFWTVASALNITRKAFFLAPTGSPIRVGDAPIGIATGDFNKDGILDLAIANANDNTITVLLGNGDGTFSPGPNSPLSTGGNFTTALVVGDFNGDGNLDIAATDVPGGLTGFLGGLFSSPGGNVSVFFGDGKGSFSGNNDSDGGGDVPGAIAVGDFNGDGKLDVAVANFDNEDLSILLNDGSGNFNQANNAPIHIGHHPTAVLVADFSLDGKLDIAVTNADDNDVVILLGKGDGTFSTAPNSPLTTGARPVALAVGDFNKDGIPDLAVANLLSSTVSIFSGNGTGAFALTNTVPVGRYPSAISVADFDSDGNLDLAVTNRFTEVVSVHLGNGAGSFGPPRSFSTDSHPQSSVVGDFNGDGKPDLAVGNVASNSVSILLNNTDTTPPVLTMPVLASSYFYNAQVTFTFGATDSQSGVAYTLATLNGAPITSGTTLTLTHLGSNTFTLTATDNNANTATQSITFSVIYNFGGFLPPIPNNGTGVFSKGGTLPVSFQLTDANGALVSTAVATLTVQQISGSVLLGVPIDATAPGNSDIGNLFRYDGQKYIYNLSTKPLATGTWQVQVNLDDGTVHTVLIGTK